MTPKIDKMVEEYLASGNTLIALRDTNHLEMLKASIESIVNETLDDYNVQIKLPLLKLIIRTLVATGSFDIEGDEEMEQIKEIHKILEPYYYNE